MGRDRQNVNDRETSWFPWSWPASRASIILTVIALALWSFSITQAEFNVGYYGLISSLPVTSFIALGILALASAVLWASPENHSSLLLLQLCLFIAGIWLTPVLVQGAQPFASDAYADLGYIEYITRHGHLDPSAVWQHNWPVAWIAWVVLIEVSGMAASDFPALIPWIPFVWQLILVPPLLLFFRNTIGTKNPNYCWAAMLLFYFGNWFETQNTGGQAFGVFFFFGMLALLTTNRVVRQTLQSLPDAITAVVILAAAAVAHLLGSLVTAAAMIGLSLSRRLKAPNLVLLAILFIAMWSMYGAITYFGWRLPSFLESGLRMDRATEKGILNALSGSESRATVAFLRILFSGLVVALAAVGGLVGWKLRNNRYSDIAVLSIIVLCGLAAIAVGAGYSHELYQRFFTFLLPALAYFAVKALLLRPTRILLCMVILAAIPVAFIAKYGNQTMDYLSPSYLAGASTFHEQTDGGYVIAGPPLGRIENYEYYSHLITYQDIEFVDGECVCHTAADPLDPTYICLSDHDLAIFDFFYGKADFMEELGRSLDSAANCSMVYGNPAMQIYVCEPTQGALE